MRAACAYAIGARKYTAGSPALLAALDDNRGETQRLAAWALGQLAEPKALGPLVRAYFARAGQGADELVWAIARTSGAGARARTARRPRQLSDARRQVLRRRRDRAICPARCRTSTASGKLVADHATDIAAGLDRGARRASRRRRVGARRSRRGAGSPRARRADADHARRQDDGRARYDRARRSSPASPRTSPTTIRRSARSRSRSIAKLDTKASRPTPRSPRRSPIPPSRSAPSAMMSVAVLAHRRGARPRRAGRGARRRRSARRRGATAGSPRSRSASSATCRGRPRRAGQGRRRLVELRPRGRRHRAWARSGGPKATEALNGLAKDDVPQVREAATRSLGQRSRH